MLHPEQLHQKWVVLQQVDPTITEPGLAAEAEIMMVQLFERLLVALRFVNQFGSTELSAERQFIDSSILAIAEGRRDIPSIVARVPIENYPPLIHRMEKICQEVEDHLIKLEHEYQIPPKPWMLRPQSSRK